MLETSRLILRLPVAGDLDWQQQWINTAAVRRHLGGPISFEDLAAGFHASAAALANGGPGYWTVVLRETGEVIGKCGLSPIETAQAPPELDGAIQAGWTLAEPFRGKGYATEAVRAVVDDAFRARGLPVLWAQTSDSNPGSTGVMRRLGFRRCAHLGYVDPAYPPQDNPTAVYRMAREEWAG